MRRYALIVMMVIVGGAVGLIGLRVARDLLPSYDRQTYRPLEADVYHPTFFARFAAARQQKAAWLRSAPTVTLRYLGYTRTCPTQQMRLLTATPGRVTLIVTRLCPYSSLATVKEYRVDLVQRDGVWEIEWAGMRLKCTVNHSPMGAYLLGHNPFWSWKIHWVLLVNNAVRNLSNALNPWLPECT